MHSQVSGEGSGINVMCGYVTTLPGAITDAVYGIFHPVREQYPDRSVPPGDAGPYAP